MKILSPIDSIAELQPLIEAGADELYCGFLDKYWLNRYTYLAATDSRNNPRSHLSSLSELKELISIAHSSSVSVFLTVNDVMYTKEQYVYILDLLKKALDCGIDGFIIADIALLVKLRESGFKGNIHISLRATAFNSETVRFYTQFGCSRINLTEDLTVAEIKDVIKYSPDGLEFETVILNGKCANVCGFCSFHHGINTINKNNNLIFDLACFKKYKISLKTGVKNNRQNQFLCDNVRPKDRDFGFTHCGACALRDFRNMGIMSVKIVGRGFPLGKKIKDVSFLRSCLDLAESGKTAKREFLNKIRLKYSQTYKSDCERYCYYYTDYHN